MNAERNMLCMNIGHSMLGFCKHLKTILKEKTEIDGVGFAEAVTLLALNDENESTGEMLVMKLSYDKSVMTRTLQNLEKMNLIIRRKNPDDKRSWLFSLTDEGKASSIKVMNAMNNWSEEVFKDMDDEEIGNLVTLIGKLNV